jgi:hypothetical protein
MPYPPSQLLNRPAGVRLSFPADTPAGTWTVTEVWLTDIVGNTATYTDLALAPITFTDNADIALTDVAVTPTEVDNWNADATSVVSATVTAPASITAAELIADAPCVVGAPTLPAGASGSITVPVTVPMGALGCEISGFVVRDEAGHVSVLGTDHWAAPLPSPTRKWGPGPEIRDITVGIDSVNWNESTNFDVTVDMHSWSPAIVQAAIWVKGSDEDFPHYHDVPNVRDGKVTFPVRALVTALGVDELTVQVSLRDEAGMWKLERDDRTIRVNRPAGLSGYVPGEPTRLLDTRTTGRPLRPGGLFTLDTEVPAGATAVVLNVTAVDPTASSHLTVWPDGTQQPNTSSLDFVAGQTVANLVTVPVSADGKVRFRNNSGSVHVVVDTFGYYSSVSGLRFHPKAPERALDTRVNNQPLGPGSERLVDLSEVVFRADAVVLNVTVTDPTASGFLTVWQDGTPRPATSNINFPAGWTGANQVIVPVEDFVSDIRLYNHAGSAHVAVDVAGYFSQDPWGSAYFVAAGPTRALDTRQSTAMGPGAVRELVVPGLPANVDAVVLNVTATEPTAAGFLTVWAGDAPRPTTSSLNFAAGQTVPNMVTVPVKNGKIQLYNFTGSTHVIVDVSGYYLRAHY